MLYEGFLEQDQNCQNPSFSEGFRVSGNPSDYRLCCEWHLTVLGNTEIESGHLWKIWKQLTTWIIELFSIFINNYMFIYLYIYIFIHSFSFRIRTEMLHLCSRKKCYFNYFIRWCLTTILSCNILEFPYLRQLWKNYSVTPTNLPCWSTASNFTGMLPLGLPCQEGTVIQWKTSSFKLNGQLAHCMHPHFKDINLMGTKSPELKYSLLY